MRMYWAFATIFTMQRAAPILPDLRQPLPPLMNSYAREIGVLKEKDANFTGADIRNGMTAVVSIKHPEPRFEGQTKTKLDNQDAAKCHRKSDVRAAGALF